MPALAAVRLDDLLATAHARAATDVHVYPGTLPALRVNGKVQMLAGSAPTGDEVRDIACRFLSDADLARLTETGDVTVGRTDLAGTRLRVHVFRGGAGWGVAIRLLTSQPPRFETLGLPKSIAAFAQRSHGLVIFAGPTGSGKSTALASIIDLINRTQPRRILTIEDPIEYAHQSQSSFVSQREVGRDVPSFTDAVMSALRADPDVILIGEMRTPETIRAALTAAETGHLVFATLHTGDSEQTVDRICASFEGAARDQVRATLAQALLGVVCLRLVPRKNGHGVVPAAEVLVANDAVRNVIRDGKTHQLRNILTTSRASGMQTLESHLGELVQAGEIEL